MKLFNVDALRLAIPNASLSAAYNLGQATLNSMLENFTGLWGVSQASLPKDAIFKQDTFKCQAGSREFRTYVPATVVEGVTGVVMMLHGCSQSPEDFAAGTGMNTLAEERRFVVVYPAQSRGDNEESCWNWFRRGDQQRGRGEPAILAGMAEQVCAEHGIDRDHTFVAGFSAGAAMAAILGEAYPDVFSAIGAHSGLPVGAAKDVASAFAAMAGNALDAPARVHDGAPVRTIVFHGIEDTTVDPSNSDRIVRRAMESGGWQSIETTEHGDVAGRTFTRTVMSNLDGIPILENWTIDGLGHAWSGGQPAGTFTDQSGPDASAEMIRFFFNTSATKICDGTSDISIRRRNRSLVSPNDLITDTSRPSPIPARSSPDLPSTSIPSK